MPWIFYGLEKPTGKRSPGSLSALPNECKVFVLESWSEASYGRTMLIRRPLSRGPLDLRPVVFETAVNAYAEGSVKIQMGRTHVWCTASVEEQVPPWMRGQGKGGWVTAEYALLPRSTHTRVKREREKLSGRTYEIQRLISRALRTCVNLEKLGERSLLIDCDVLQADGGTRTAAITGGCVALALAVHSLVEAQKVPASVWETSVAGISGGWVQGNLLVDLDYAEDSQCEVDMNFAGTNRGEWVELQGTGERRTFSQSQLLQLTEHASQALGQLRVFQKQAFESAFQGKTPLFPFHP